MLQYKMQCDHLKVFGLFSVVNKEASYMRSFEKKVNISNAFLPVLLILPEKNIIPNSMKIVI